MKKYKTKEVKSGKEMFFRSYSEINEKYSEVTTYNLAYHFSRCKKKEVVIKGVLIEKL
jgi:hypothetical protein